MWLFLFNLFRYLFREQFTEIVTQQIEKYKLEQKILEREKKVRELLWFTDRPLIYFREDIANPIIGFGDHLTKDENDDPVLVVRNYLNNEIVQIKEIPYPFEKALFHGAYSLDATTVHMFVHHNREFYHRRKTDSRYRKPIEPIATLVQAMDCLRTNGFYDRLDEHEIQVQELETT